MTTCPTCKRRPSERYGPVPFLGTVKENARQRFQKTPCVDPCHDLADNAPDLRCALQYVADYLACLHDDLCAKTPSGEFPCSMAAYEGAWNKAIDALERAKGGAK